MSDRVVNVAIVVGTIVFVVGMLVLLGAGALGTPTPTP